MSRQHAKLDRRRWTWVRRKVLKRDNWRCRKCGKYGNEVDHIQPLQKGGDPWVETNLQCLCRDCHIAKTSGENTRSDPARDEWAALVRELST